jgi:hypothetical protein
MNQKGKKGSHGGHGVAEDLLPIPVKQMFSVYDPQIARKTTDRIENTEYRIPNPNTELRTERRTPNCEQRTTNPRAHRGLRAMLLSDFRILLRSNRPRRLYLMDNDGRKGSHGGHGGTE